MPETAQPTQDVSGVTRTPTGEIVSPQPTSTPPSETIVRPPATPATTTPSTEPKAASDGKEAPKPNKSFVNEESSPQGAPDKYEDFKAPEGFRIDEDIAKEAGTLFKKGNLSQAYAQELVDFYIKHTSEAFNAQQEFYQQKQQEWLDQIRSDPDIGGSKLPATKVSIGKLFDSLGNTQVTDAFREAMDYTGAGNHPGVVKFLNLVAQRLTEGGAVRGNGPSSEGQRVPGTPAIPSAAAALYPHLPSSADRR